MQVACLRCLPARKPLRRFSTLRRFPPFLPCRTPVRSISDTHPVDIGHRSGPNRTPFRSHRKTVRHQSGRLSDFNRNTVRFESERCPTSNRIGVRFASEYASKGQLALNGVKNLSVPAAISLAKIKPVPGEFNSIRLKSLSLTPEIAAALAKYQGDQWACFDKTDREKGGYWLVVFEFKLSG